jgi:hypothetical protein
MGADGTFSVGRIGAGEIMWEEMMSGIGRRLRSRYVVLLEEEVARLRAENRSLVNSLFGTAGFPPVLPEDESRRPGMGLAAVRRRTWSQIAREREFAAGQNSAGRNGGEK